MEPSSSQHTFLLNRCLLFDLKPPNVGGHFNLRYSSSGRRTASLTASVASYLLYMAGFFYTRRLEIDIGHVLLKPIASCCRQALHLVACLSPWVDISFNKLRPGNKRQMPLPFAPRFPLLSWSSLHPCSSTFVHNKIQQQTTICQHPMSPWRREVPWTLSLLGTLHNMCVSFSGQRLCFSSTALTRFFKCNEQQQ